MLEMVAKIALGVVLVGAGLAMLVLPGPGLAVLALGVAMILSQSETGRRLIARVRVRLRDRFGSPAVRRFEARLPRDVVPPADTSELRLEALRRRRHQDSASSEA